MTSDQGRRRLRAYLELVRLPNIFTAMADVAMGFLFVRAIAGPRDTLVLGLLIGASSLLYASGVVLNDVFDLPFDTRWRPERPLPSGRVSPAVARWIGWESLLLGVALGWGAALFTGHLRPGIVAAVLAGCIVAYNAALKRTPAGPLVMGLCRMLNVLLGMSVAVDPISGAAAAWGAENWIVAGGIGTYIVGVTWFARTEARGSSRLHLSMATAVMLSGVALLACLPLFSDRLPGIQRDPLHWCLLMALLGLLIGWRSIWAVVEPVRHRVQTAVRQFILSLVVIDAAVCFAARGTAAAVTILLLLVPAIYFGRWIEST